MTRRLTGIATGTAILLTAGLGCSSSSSSGATSYPSCSASEQLHIQGTASGKSIDIVQPTAVGGFVNLSSGNFSTPFGATGGADGGAAVETLVLDWTGPVADGSSAPATGTLTMIASDPLGAITLCAGSGSEIAFPASSGPAGLDFVLSHLTMGPGCTEPVSGELRGCWQSTQ